MNINRNNSDAFIKKYKGLCFLETPSSKHVLCLIEYLTQSTNKIVLIIGNTQAGKSSLMTAFLQRLPKNIWCHSINGCNVGDKNVFIASICQSFNLPMDPEYKAKNFIQLLDIAVKNLDDPPSRQLVVIDDAQVLDEATLDFAMQLSQYSLELNSGFKLVLFACPELAARISKLSNAKKLFYQHDISPLKIEECHKLLNLHINFNPSLSQSMLSDKLFKQIYQVSGGVPGVLLQEYAAITSCDNECKSPFSKRYSLVLLLLVIIVTIIYFIDDIDKTDITLTNTSAVKTTITVGNGKINRQMVDPLVAAKAVFIEQVLVDDNAPAPAPAPAPEIAKPEITKPEITKPEITKPEITKPEITKPEITKPEIAKPENLINKEADVVDVTIQPKFSYSATEQLILSFKPNNYTIQLIGSNTIARISQLLVEEQDDGFMIAEVSRNNASWYVLLYGQYNSRQAAVNAEAKLNNDWRKLKPWIRRISGIQKALQNKANEY